MDSLKDIGKILSGNRITLPKKYIDLHGLEEGDHVKWEIEDGKLVITPVRIKVEELD